jgi:hypothetical protein
MLAFQLMLAVRRDFRLQPPALLTRQVQREIAQGKGLQRRHIHVAEVRAAERAAGSAQGVAFPRRGLALEFLINIAEPLSFQLRIHKGASTDRLGQRCGLPRQTPIAWRACALFR